jgi:hypothetical protein
MKTKVQKRLTLLLVLALAISLFAGISVGTAAEGDTIYLAFTSDVHYDTAYEQNHLDVWLTNIQKVVDGIDYMGFCGDVGSAYAATTDKYWEFVQAAIDTANKYVESGFIKNRNIFVDGNHEWYPSAGGDKTNNPDHPTVKQFEPIGESVRTDDYIIYSFGAASTAANHAQEFLDEDIETLKAYLETAPTDIPIIILTHFPIHCFSSRYSNNADKMIDLLNNSHNVIFLWGHNHNVNDTYYDRVHVAGDELEITDNVFRNIAFTYLAAGCMSDAEYSTGSAFVEGKGLLMAINGSEVSFAYYDHEGNALAEAVTVDISKPYNAEGPFTIKFKDGIDGSIIAEQTVEKGKAATAPEAPEHDGYEFIGWNRDFDNITGNMVVTALYDVVKVPLTPQAKLDKNYVYLSLATAEGTVVGKSGKPIALYPIPWTEGMTVVDAVTKLHELEYEAGVEGVAADNPYGFYCFTKIWGMTPEYNTLAFDSNNYLDAGNKTKGGDVYYFVAYGGMEATYATTSLISPCKAEAVTGDSISMQVLAMNMNPDYTYSPVGFAADIYVGKSFDSLTDTGTDSNDLGNFSISFDALGTYYVVAKDKAGVHADAVAVVDIKNADDLTPLYEIVRTSMTIKVNGEVKAIEAYNVDGSTYLKLRDVAFTLNGTGSQFSVDYDEATKTINCVTGAAYSPDGKELQIGEDKSAVGKPSSQSLIIDGKTSNLTAFSFAGNNFFKLRELGKAFKFDVDYDDATRTVLINSREVVSAEEKGDPIGTAYFFAVTDNDILTDTEGKEIAYYPISIYNGDTIADAITTLHQEAYGDGYAWGYEENSSYGYVLNKLWGIDCGSMSYGGGLWTDFSEGLHCDPNDPAENGMIIYLNNFTSSAGIHCRTGYFDMQYVELNAGESITLTYNRCSGDGVVKACSSAPVYVDGESKGSTDGSGKIELTFDAPGEYIVRGEGRDSFSCAVCYVVVK